MFEPFSRGYYLGRLYVEPHDDETARMCQAQHRQVAHQLYGEEGQSTDETPLVMKLGTRHFPVRGQSGVPADTISVPSTILADAAVDNPPSLAEVLLAKADRAAQLLRLTDGAVDEDGQPTDVDGAATDRDWDGDQPWRDGSGGPAGF